MAANQWIEHRHHTHYGKVTPIHVEGAPTFAMSECFCGWSGPNTDGIEAARTEFTRHAAEAGSKLHLHCSSCSADWYAKTLPTEPQLLQCIDMCGGDVSVQPL